MPKGIHHSSIAPPMPYAAAVKTSWTVPVEDQTAKARSRQDQKVASTLQREHARRQADDRKFQESLSQSQEALAEIRKKVEAQREAALKSSQEVQYHNVRHRETELEKATRQASSAATKPRQFSSSFTAPLRQPSPVSPAVTRSYPPSIRTGLGLSDASPGSTTAGGKAASSMGGSIMSTPYGPVHVKRTVPGRSALASSMTSILAPPL
eukprot:GGOE01041709.1.p1 GENE.GGOE01041709.1~~GGOE01041709.1.p1  ORF type:complete len:238 (-),score=49.03 GGOE01041709.1:343-969(-)